MIHIVAQYLFPKIAMPVLWFAGFLLIFPQHGYAAGSSGDSISLDSGFREMYNLDFAAAHKTFEKWEALHPEDPLGPASNGAAYLFGEFDRLHILEFDLLTDTRRTDQLDKFSPDPEIKIAFESELAKADAISRKILDQYSDDHNALFARILTDGLRGDYAGLVEKRKRDALYFLKSSRSIAEKLIAIAPDYSDAYLAIGIENYILGIRSAPTRWMLHLAGAETNKDKGIENLKVTAEKGRYLAPYARLLLVVAYLREEDRNSAKRLLADLVRDFPGNHRYQAELAHLRS
jgi:hypothetical protein